MRRTQILLRPATRDEQTNLSAHELSEEEGSDEHGQAYQLPPETRENSERYHDGHGQAERQHPTPRKLLHARAAITKRHVQEEDEWSDCPKAHTLM